MVAKRSLIQVKRVVQHVPDEPWAQVRDAAYLHETALVYSAPVATLTIVGRSTRPFIA